MTELKCNTILKVKFEELPAIPTADDAAQFWKLLPCKNCPNLRKSAQPRVSAVLSSTEHCQQAFSSMKQVMDKQQSQLLDCNLKNLAIVATKLQSAVDKLAG
jgi:hypothetical protein